MGMCLEGAGHHTSLGALRNPRGLLPPSQPGGVWPGMLVKGSHCGTSSLAALPAPLAERSDAPSPGRQLRERHVSASPATGRPRAV